MTYEGYTNWETWHTSLLIDNEYDIYQEKVALVKKKASIGEFKLKLKKAEIMTRKYHKENWKGEKFQPVNWQEIYDRDMQEEYD